MHKRKREAIIRFKKFNEEKDGENYYRAKLKLFLHWRKEDTFLHWRKDTDLLKNYPDYATNYNAVLNEIHEQEGLYNHNLDLIDTAVEQNASMGPPKHAWANHSKILDNEEGIQVDRDLCQEDLDANGALFQGPPSNAVHELSARYQAQIMLPAPKYRRMCCLNGKQRQSVMYYRRCKIKPTDAS